MASLSPGTCPLSSRPSGTGGSTALPSAVSGQQVGISLCVCEHASGLWGQASGAPENSITTHSCRYKVDGWQEDVFPIHPCDVTFSPAFPPIRSNAEASQTAPLLCRCTWRPEAAPHEPLLQPQKGKLSFNTCARIQMLCLVHGSRELR